MSPGTEPAPAAAIRIDLSLIAGLIPAGARVLDVGCGDGLLLEYLTRARQVDGRGIELSMEGVRACVSRGLPVIQGDAETDLAAYPARAFDYVVLSQTLQAMRTPRRVLEQMLRIGDRAIVSLPNFGHWRVRLDLLLRGRMPVTRHLPQPWWDTGNIHLCTIADFADLAQDMGLVIERSLILNGQDVLTGFQVPSRAANILGMQGVFQLCRRPVL